MTHKDLQGAKVLLVDDQPANLDVLCELLEAEGCKVATRAEAVPDLVLFGCDDALKRLVVQPTACSRMET